VVGVLEDGVQDALQVVASVVDEVQDAVLLEGTQVGELLVEDLLDLVQVLTIDGLDVGDLDQKLQELAALQKLAVRGTNKLVTIDRGRVDGGGHNLQALQLLLERLGDDSGHNGLEDHGGLLDLSQDVRDISLALVQVELKELAVLTEQGGRLRLDAAALVDDHVLLIEVFLNIRDKVVDEASSNDWGNDRRDNRGGHDGRRGRVPFLFIY